MHSPVIARGSLLAAMLLVVTSTVMAQPGTDTKTIGGALLQEVLRHRLVKFEDSPLAKFYPRTSILAGAGEKIANTFIEENGNRLGFMLTESAQPSGVSDNPYVNFTKGGGAQSYEARLADRIAASPGDLMPDQVLGMALDVCSGDYWAATLTVHNLLKEVTYAQRTGQQPVVGWDNANAMDAGQWKLIPASSVIDRLRNLRPAGDQFASDKMGPWYHMFGLFFIGGMTSGTEAEFLAWMENVTRRLGLGSSEDAFKMDMNTWAAGLCHSLNALVEQGLYAPLDLTGMSKEELQATFDALRAKHRSLQEELETWAGLVNHPELGDTAEWQMDVIRNQQKAIYNEAIRVRNELNSRP
jgi:hypothetical protein